MVTRKIPTTISTHFMPSIITWGPQIPDTIGACARTLMKIGTSLMMVMCLNKK